MRKSEDVIARIIIFSILETAIIGILSLNFQGNKLAFLALLIVFIFNMIPVFIPWVKDKKEPEEMRAFLIELLGKDADLIKSLTYDTKAERWILYFDEERCFAHPKAFPTIEEMIDFLQESDWRTTTEELV